MHRCADCLVPSRTISLEESAYQALAAAKQPGESFSRVVLRLLEADRPKLASLAGLLGPEAASVKATVSRLRREDQSSQRGP